jgi:hypothetical protein
VVPLDVLFQIVGLDVAGFTSLRGAHERTVVVVNHRVFHKVVLLRKSGPTIRDIALERPLARMNPFVLSGIARRHFFAALPEPA